MEDLEKKITEEIKLKNKMANLGYRFKGISDEMIIFVDEDNFKLKFQNWEFVEEWIKNIALYQRYVSEVKNKQITNKN